jgi:dihydroorotase
MILIKNAKLTDGNIVDILIKDRIILTIDENIKKNGAKVIDAKKAYILPPITDLNIRIRDDSLSKKNLDEIEKRALKAGISTVVLNCNFTPNIEDKTHLELLYHQLKSRKINFILNIKGLNSQNRLNNISILLKAGAKVIFENSDISTNNLRRISQYALMHKTPLFIFCQNRDLNENGVINEAEVSFELGLPGISKVGEISEVAKVSAISEYYKVPTHFQTISTAKSIEIAKQNPLSTIEVSLHHLLKSDESCKDFNTYAKINPPLRSENERAKLLKALKDKKIDTITTLFSPQSITNKDLPFEQAKFGIDEIEEFLPLIYTNLVKTGYISMRDVEKMLCKNPVKILNQKEPSIKEGEKASFILFDTNFSKKYNNKTSIYYGEEIVGKISFIFFSTNC